MAQARLLFENGCVANLSVSRVSAAPVRRMQVWGAEGFACVDFARKHLTLVQPSEELRGRRLDPRRLDAAGTGRAPGRVAHPLFTDRWNWIARAATS